jgi:hypothetical protein
VIPSTPETLQLRDIHLPGSPSLWPPAPGWWIAAIVTLALLIWISVLVWRSLKIRRQRKQILGLLEQLEQSSSNTRPTEFLARLSRLLRRLALMRFPRDEIAPLTGKDWLRFLDESGGNGQFCQGPGQVLADGPYVRDLPDGIDTRALTKLVRDWIRKNSGA